MPPRTSCSPSPTARSPAPPSASDLNLREAFVELLLSYQPQWLQVGLEVVLGVEVSRVAKRDGHLVHLPITTVLRKLIVQVRRPV